MQVVLSGGTVVDDTGMRRTDVLVDGSFDGMLVGRAPGRGLRREHGER